MAATPRALACRAARGAVHGIWAAALLAGCGGGAPPPVVQRLELTPDREFESGLDPELHPEFDPGLDAVRAVAATRTVQVFEVGEELPRGWRVEGAEYTLVHETRPSRGGPWHGLAVKGPRQSRVIVPGPFDPRTFNRLAVTLVQSRWAELQILLYRDGGVISRTPNLRVEGIGDGKPHTLVLDLPDTLNLEGPLDAIGIGHINRGRRPVYVSFALLWTPLEHVLSHNPGEPTLLAMDDEFRSAVVLSSARPLRAHFVAPPGACLVLGFGRPRGVAREKDELTLHVRVDGARGLLAEERFPLPRDGPELLRWSDGSLSLAGAGDRRLHATFTLEGAGPEGAVCALAVPRVEGRGSTAPTVVLVTSDTHRADHLGIAPRGIDVRTPFLDSLAQRGVFFEDCFASTNITNPSHAALHTALPVRDLGMVDNLSPLAGEALTLAERFRDAGFLTLAAVSAGHLGHGQSGLGQGFDRMYAPPGHRPVDSTVTLERLGPWIAQAEGRPLFLWLHLFDAHAPYQPPASHRWLYYDRERDPRDPALPVPPRRPSWDREVRDLEFVSAQYRSEVTYQDEQLGAFLDHPRFRDAVLAVTADHGESLGEHGVYYAHLGLFPTTLAVPLILAWPDAPAGTRVAAPVSNTDLGRTLLDLAGLEGADFPGRDLRRFLGADPPPPTPRFAISSEGSAASVEHGGWFLVLSLRRQSHPPRAPHQVELYHLPSDPGCRDDLLDEQHDLARALRRMLVEWLAAAPAARLSRRPTQLDAEALTQLAALGYAADDSPPRGAEGAWYEPDPDSIWVRRFEE